MAVNNGAWRHVAASLGPAGMKLYIDGTLVGSNPTTTTAANFTGYVRVGGMNLSGFPDRPKPAVEVRPWSTCERRLPFDCQLTSKKEQQ
ncbi:hypothetical protein GCM10010201_02270 [Pilimelia columellifera subsp. columellifera]|uniref:LamG domain-containing protein n=1 Tax=Pilimelia columellifera subsp. columellifera TaxID=706583 RepID=A0ABN3MYP7_9ACTN